MSAPHPLLFGSFNAERFWRDPDAGTLPSFTDDQANRIVEAMDEMQFVFGHAQQSTLVTRFKMNAAHLSYLSTLGFTCSNTGITETSSMTEPDADHTTTTALYAHFKAGNQFAIPEHATLDPYAIIPDFQHLTRLSAATSSFPELKAVKEVNSKVFSTHVSAALEKGCGGYIADSTAALQQNAETLLKTSGIIIKDPFGVSGNGNILIKKEISLRSIVKHLLRQEQAGKIIQFVIEPFLDKQTDFSCQCNIAQNGDLKIISFHIMHNDKFRFSGIERADEQFISKLNELGYMDYITAAARQVFQAGYFGPVCIDSMILTNGDLIPIVEINARKSMGLINHALFTHLTRSNKNLKCRMMTLNFMVDYRLDFDQLLEKLKLEGLLFENDRLSGILPLSANTVDINSKNLTEGPFKGRLYYHIVYTVISDLHTLQERMQKFCEKLNLKTLQ